MKEKMVHLILTVLVGLFYGMGQTTEFKFWWEFGILPPRTESEFKAASPVIGKRIEALEQDVVDGWENPATTAEERIRAQDRYENAITLFVKVLEGVEKKGARHRGGPFSNFILISNNVRV